MNGIRLILAPALLAFSLAAHADPSPHVCDVKAYGAQGDGIARDTAAIQAAIDACAGTGGSVVLKGGTFLSGMIRLKSGMKFRVEAGASLKGTQDDADYPT